MDKKDLNDDCKNTAVDERAEGNFITESGKKLSGAAKRALAEAAQRRISQTWADRPPEIAGRGGLDPVRFGDWEKKGLISDF